VISDDTWPVLATLASISPSKYRSVILPSSCTSGSAMATRAASPVRNTRIVGLPGKSSMTVRSSPAAMIAFLKLAWTAAAWLASIRVPICAHALDNQRIDACVHRFNGALYRSDAVDDGHTCVVQSRGEQRGITRGGEYVPNLGHDELVDDGWIASPALDHPIGRAWPVGELAHPSQVSPALGGQRLDHAHAATLGDGGGQFGPGDARHRRLDDGILDV
jgi:hypothetical protein